MHGFEIQKAITYNSMPPCYRIQSTLNNLEKETGKRKSDDECNDIHRPKMKNCLVIPYRSLNDTTTTIHIIPRFERYINLAEDILLFV